MASRPPDSVASSTPGSAGTAGTALKARKPASSDIRMTYIRPPVILYISIPREGFKDIEGLDENMYQFLGQLAAKHKVEIGVISGQLLFMSGKSKKAASDAVKEIFEALKRRVDDSALWHPQVLIDPSCWDTDHEKVIIKASSNTSLGVRPFLPVAPTTGDQPLPTPLSPTVKEERVLAYREEFWDNFRKIFQNTRYIPSKMRMRVVYGAFRLEQWKKGQEEYEKDEFIKVVKRAGIRGTCRMDKLIGRDKTAKKLIQIICQNPDFFTPVNIQISRLRDVRPVHYLILVMGLLKVEIQIAIVSGAVGPVWTMGTLRAFRREKQEQAITLITTSPQLPFDWYLEVENQINNPSLPFTQQEINRATTFKGVDKFRFPEMNITGEFIRKHGVQAILGKSISSFNMNNWSYNLDVSVYKRWDLKTREPMQVGAGVELYGEDWSYMMTDENLAGKPRDWAEDLSGFFPKDPKSQKDGLTDFLDYVLKVQHWLKEASVSASE